MRLTTALVLLLAIPLAHGNEATQLIAELGLEAAPTPVSKRPDWRKPVRVIVRAASPAQLAAYQSAAPGVEIIAARDEAAALPYMSTADALIGFCATELIEAGPELRWIQLFSAGINTCADLPAVRSRDLLITNMQRISGPEIAEHSIAMLMAFTRGLHSWLPQQKSGAWNPGTFSTSRMWELKGRTMLVVGLGGIGTEVARRASALGMRVIATRASDAPKPAFVDHVGRPGELLTLAAEADVVVNCAPLLPETTKLFDRTFFNTVRKGAYFINVGRGKSVVQADLLAALRSGQLGGAGLDVTEPEPLPADDPLWQEPNVIITPHIAGMSDRVFARVGLLAQENLRRYVAGEPMLSVVDIERGY
jgi:phosphoglycerate dehydrogenase-like enzyme